MRSFLIVLMLVLMSTSFACANTIFYDNFNTENNGVGVLNYNNFTNWTVTDGTVDLIGNGYWQLNQPLSYGLFVDLDGSTYNAGNMATSSTFTLLANTDYMFSFDLAGNNRNTDYEEVTASVSLGNGTPYISSTYSLSTSAQFQTFSFLYSVGASDIITNLSFEALGGDNIGMLLDNVKIEDVAPVPEPSTWILLGTGLVGLAYYRKRRVDC